jgi:hypothetical protein
MKVEFVKGHCGWDTLTLIPAGTIPAERELEAALKIIDAPVSGGLEVGYLARGERTNQIRLRVANSTMRGWIPMCGGMTQVIGKALVETRLREQFGVDVTQPAATVELVTDSGVITLQIEIEDRKARNTVTVMDDYAAYLYRCGVRPLVLEGVEALDLGEFLVVDLAALEARHPGIDFTSRAAGLHLEIINRVLAAYQHRRGTSGGVHGMMYDNRPEGPGHFRVYPRFISDDMAAARIPFEFQCGTGTVAVGIAIAHYGQLPFAAEQGEILFEWGSHRTTPDPYGIRTSRLQLQLDNQRVVGARFSHSVVEILAEGVLTVPGY